MTAITTDEVSLREWAEELEAAATIARQLAPTAFMPDSLRRFHRDDNGRVLDGKDGRPYRVDVDATTATAAAAIMTGKELGLPPGAALRSIAVINNTPALSALALRAILQTNGHEIWVAPESNSSRAIVRARRGGSDEVQQSTWSIERAKLAGLYPGSEKGQWRKNPAAMLVARATAEVARWIAADAILGVPYSVEELIDEIEGSPEWQAVEAAAAEGAAAALEAPPRAPKPRKPRAARAALPAAPPAEIPAEPAEPDALISKAQLTKLHVGMKAIGETDQDRALGLISVWANRRDDSGRLVKLASSRELTADEADSVLDAIEALRTIAAQDQAGEPEPGASDDAGEPA